MSKEINKGVFVYGTYYKKVIIENDTRSIDETYEVLSDDYDIYEFDELPCLENVREYYDDNHDEEDDKNFDDLSIEEKIDIINEYENDDVCFVYYFNNKEEAQEFCNQLDEDFKKFEEELKSDRFNFCRTQRNNDDIIFVYRIDEDEEE